MVTRWRVSIPGTRGRKLLDNTRHYRLIMVVQVAPQSVLSNFISQGLGC